MKRVRLNISLPSNLHASVKSVAAEKGVTIQNFVEYTLGMAVSVYVSKLRSDRRSGNGVIITQSVEAK